MGFNKTANTDKAGQPATNAFNRGGLLTTLRAQLSCSRLAALPLGVAVSLGLASVSHAGSFAANGERALRLVQPATASASRFELTLPADNGYSSAATIPALRDSEDAGLQAELDSLFSSSAIKRAIREQRFSAALVDITNPAAPKMAAVNGDTMVYAASLPKIAILLGAFEQIERGEMTLDGKTKSSLTRMIRRSSNSAATEMYYAVGPARLAEILRSDKYGLYDTDYNGGLWVGKPYAKQRVWRRDPLHNISHGATAIQVARFFYLLENGLLVSPEASLQMKEILGNPGIRHKFVKGLDGSRPGSEIFRKSGSWRTYHADAGIIERNGRRYIAVMLANDAKGGSWLSELIVGFDDIIHSDGTDGLALARR